jgi:methylmalonyl-CoA mutase N-terminal domain/subunit
MRDRFGATEPRAQQLRFHAQTAGSTLTAQQPDNNIVRVTLQALAAVLGGAQSIHTNGRDEALALPTEESATIALRTQQILLHESGVAATADPAGGAYAVEELTARIESDARRIMEGLDARGGVLAAIEHGSVQREIQESAYRTQRAIDAGEQVVVGVNRFGENAAPGVDVFRMDPDIERAQIERLRALRASRSDAAAREALAAVDAAARGTDNVVPPILAAVERLATLGEIADTLRGVFGEHQDAQRV